MNEINLFETRTMLETFEQIKPVRTWFLSMFFAITNTSNTKTVDIDVIKGKRRLAPFVAPNRQGVMVERKGYRTDTFKPPYVKPKMITTAEDILKRQPGNIIYAPNSSPAIMAAEQMGKDMAELDEMITRREEWMAAKALMDGQIRVIGEGVDKTIDFGMDADAKPVLSGTSLWTDHTNATPLDDLNDWAEQTTKKSGKNVNICVMGTTAWRNFMKCDSVIGTTGGGKNLFSMRAVDIGEINPRNLPDGSRYKGRLTEVGVDVYTYDEWYIDDESGIEEPLVPANKVMLGATNARCERNYAAIRDLGAMAPMARFPKSWEENDPSERFLMVQSAPLMVPVEIDAFLSATVV